MISQSMPAPVFQMKMSEDELAFVNVQDDVDDDDDDDAFTTEEELCLRQDMVREFFPPAAEGLKRICGFFSDKDAGAFKSIHGGHRH